MVMFVMMKMMVFIGMMIDGDDKDDVRMSMMIDGDRDHGVAV